MEENRQDFLPGTLVPGEAAALRRPARVPSTAFERSLVARFLQWVGSPPIRIRLWDGQEIDSGIGSREQATVLDRTALWRLMLNPSLGFGEEYAAGGIEVDGDINTFMEAVLSHRPSGMDERFIGARLLRRQVNSLTGSRANIRHHYDIGNDFYALWLDREMAYTCAYFPDASASLEAAQFAKFDLVCRKLQLKPSETVIEAGCGWGGLARHMARYYGVRVKAYNISHEQVAYARERVRAEGLDDRVQFIEDDYRTVIGRFDAFVSVGMLEHVGAENYRDLGRAIDRCLDDRRGRGLIHSIGQNRSEPLGGFIEKHIFPGAYPPTLREMAAILEPHGFTITDVENLRPHYARTLEHWLARFDQNTDQVREMFDERFVRAWRLYLASSRASFAVGHLQLFQMVFSRPSRTDWPETRAYLYGNS